MLSNIVNISKKNLENYLIVNNFENLRRIFKKKQFHIHDGNLESILTNYNKIYICSCDN